MIMCIAKNTSKRRNREERKLECNRSNFLRECSKQQDSDIGLVWQLTFFQETFSTRIDHHL